MKVWGLMSKFTGEVKKTDSSMENICLIKKGDLMSFKTKREALYFIYEHCAWALMPVHILYENTYWNSEESNYHFFYDFNKK